MMLLFAAAEKSKQAFANTTTDVNGIPNGLDADAVAAWTRAVKIHFLLACKEFLSCLSSVDADTVASFSEAAALTASFVTTTENKKVFKRSWIMEVVALLNDIHEAKGTVQPRVQSLSSVLGSRNALLSNCDKRFPDCLDDLAAHLKLAEKRASVQEDIYHLQVMIGELAQKLDTVSKYCLLRHQVSDITPWTAGQWRKYSHACLVLCKWTELTLETSPRWMKWVCGTLELIKSQFPGKLPNTLLTMIAKHRLCEAEEDIFTSQGSGFGELSLAGKHAASNEVAVTKIKRIEPSSIPAVITAVTREKMARYLNMVVKLQRKWSEGDDGKADQRLTKEQMLQLVFVKAHNANQQFLDYITWGRADEDTALTFGEASRVLVMLICQCPCEWLDEAQIKNFLRKQEHIFEACAATESMRQVALPLTESYLRLRQYCVGTFDGPMMGKEESSACAETKPPTLPEC